jgi:8-oxo-dGTP pyrophosphatase MutT (NUDIX family)
VGLYQRQVFWATPGGGLEDGESYEDAALRELFEEVGLSVEHPGAQIAQRMARFTIPSGETVEADERFFVIFASESSVTDRNWTELEQEVMEAHHWWDQVELQCSIEQIWPDDLAQILIDAGIWGAN